MADFAVGDSVRFERRFSPGDFTAFSRLSGDANRLHHDAGFAERSQFGRPIVPLHMTLAPLSMIAGMIFPGEPSLYLGHEVSAVGPVFYDEPVSYSARIEAVNETHRVLTLRVLALHRMDVVLDATMRVRALVAEWDSPAPTQIRKASAARTALVTGATGDIGSAICVALAKLGWNLLLQDRKAGERRARLEQRLSLAGVKADFVSADLSDPKGRATLGASVSKHDDIALVVHAASPGVDADVSALVAVNFTALREITAAVLPQMLLGQSGSVVLLGSSATEYTTRGWEAYAGAKCMAGNLVDGIERSYAKYGVRGLTLMPGLVATRFSESFRGDSSALLPEEVAEALVRLASAPESASNVVMIEPGREVRGRSGFHSGSAAPAPAARAAPAAASPEPATSGSVATGAVTVIARELLRLPQSMDLADAALGITPGWDSLRHIELLLAIESKLQIRFAGDEMEHSHSLATLEALAERKLSEKRPR